MDRMDWNWNEDQELPEEKVSYTVDEILAEFWSEYSEPVEQETVSAEENKDETYFEWEAGTEAYTPFQKAGSEEVFSTADGYPDQTAGKDIIGEEPVQYMGEDVRLPAEGETAAEEKDAESPVIAEKKTAVPSGRKGKKGAWEQFPDSPPKETEESFVDDFDYSTLFKMFADPAKEPENPIPEKIETEESAQPEEVTAEEAQDDLTEQIFQNGSEDADIEEDPKDADQSAEEEPPAKEEKEEARPLLAEDTLDFRDILREFMLGDQHPIYADIPGIGNAVTAEDVLSGAAPVENQTLVVIGGGVTGLETAEYLVPRNKVTVVEMMDKIGGNLYPSVVMHLATEIVKNGGTIAKGCKLTAIEEGQVRVTEVATGEEKCLPADTVVLAMGVRSNRPEIDAFRAEYGDKLILVGDTSKPGQIYDALHSGHDRAFVYDT